MPGSFASSSVIEPFYEQIGSVGANEFLPSYIYRGFGSFSFLFQ
jgi:hypothetical protein